MKKMNYSSMNAEIAGIPVSQIKKWFRHQLAKQVQQMHRRKLSSHSADSIPAAKSEAEVCAPEDALNVQPSGLLVFQMQRFMEREYELRYNELKCEVEYRIRQDSAPTFRPLLERDLNSMILRAQECGLPVWDRDIKRYVNSDRIKEYNPVDNYLDHLPQWDGKERICGLADLIPTNNAA